MAFFGAFVYFDVIRVCDIKNQVTKRLQIYWKMLHFLALCKPKQPKSFSHYQPSFPPFKKRKCDKKQFFDSFLVENSVDKWNKTICKNKVNKKFM